MPSFSGLEMRLGIYRNLSAIVNMFEMRQNTQNYTLAHIVCVHFSTCIWHDRTRILPISALRLTSWISGLYLFLPHMNRQHLNIVQMAYTAFLPVRAL